MVRRRILRVVKSLTKHKPPSARSLTTNLAIRSFHRLRIGHLVLLPMALSLVSFACRAPLDLTFSGESAYEHLLRQMDFGPRPVGSEASVQTAAYIGAVLGDLGWDVARDDFEFRGITGSNVVASKGSGPLYLLGAHYDTRTLADRDPEDPTQPVPGANDGASGVAVLLELARVIDPGAIGVQVWLVFFDAEDQGNIGGWPFSVGASHMASDLSEVPEAVIVVDMIGDADQQIFFEGNSDAQLMATLWAIADQLGYGEHFVPQYRYTIIDDHLPFRQRGLVAVDIIDFDYPYWHTTEDTADKVSSESLQRVGRVLESWLEHYLPTSTAERVP